MPKHRTQGGSGPETTQTSPSEAQPITPSPTGPIPPVLVIGGGNMASAILSGAERAGVLSSPPVVVEPDESRRARYTLGVASPEEGFAKLTELEQVEHAGRAVVMLAVKPQVFPVVAGTLAECLTRQGRHPLEGRTVISIMAGVRSETIRAALCPTVRVVRVMPNTPAAVGMGMSAIALGAGSNDTDADVAASLMSAVGSIVRIDESMMDAFTALAGSGPAYVFKFAEALISAGCANGFDEELATRIVVQTLAGSVRMLSEAHHDGTATAAELRTAVTSPKGTTAAALDVFDADCLDEMVARAVAAAVRRGGELAAGN